MKKNYIGLSCTMHDSALAILNEHGEVLFAEATERYLQNKRAINCQPDQSVRISKLIKEYCDPDADLVLAETWSDSSAETFTRVYDDVMKVSEGVENFPQSLKEVQNIVQYVAHSQVRFPELTGQTLKYEYDFLDGYTGKISSRRYDHHLTHAATACFSSPYDEAVCAVVDGTGEGTATNFYIYRDGKLEEIAGQSQEGLGSLGAFYVYVCLACGFGALTGEEWKVMGLAPYGKKDPELYDIMRSMIEVEGLAIKQPTDGRFERAIQALYERRRAPDAPLLDSADMAHTGQLVFCEIIEELLSNLHDLGLSDNLVLGGGCALNSAENGLLTERTGFKSLHVYSAPADDGNALGAAQLAFYEDNPDKVPEADFQSPYLGSKMSDLALESLVKFSGIQNIQKFPGEIHKKAAALLAEGKIIGWVQGRAEFGPRALGNRSILADPRRKDMKDNINARVKFREEFRPFAPSILDEYGEMYFENYQRSPYMERTLVFREEVRDRIPAVVHENGTGRLQSVKREWNERYYDLISEFNALTDVPVLLNTSFNIMGKPIIHSVEDAIAVFYTTGLDALVIDDYLITK
ncbi:hypothetical protein A7985_02000 [Pseudoalteromonas luteoviolacea]|uniref:Carbamoyltransferase n=1 Tax=Pseudoalteromonas luteoviolacea TaxID=43657 RepID=A0A1C0TU42_9GAMM|nr:carbamoyltransferase C-terminal domain-containing protein [Pseudoalteromonas luteoviolacea]OCQ22754.1 hypothetical protein A7985_02000 [Pseudoalteromonas luteoviolacea]